MFESNINPICPTCSRRHAPGWCVSQKANEQAVPWMKPKSHFRTTPNPPAPVSPPVKELTSEEKAKKEAETQQALQGGGIVVGSMMLLGLAAVSLPVYLTYKGVKAWLDFGATKPTDNRLTAGVITSIFFGVSVAGAGAYYKFQQDFEKARKEHYPAITLVTNSTRGYFGIHPNQRTAERIAKKKCSDAGNWFCSVKAHSNAGNKNCIVAFYVENPTPFLKLGWNTLTKKIPTDTTLAQFQSHFAKDTAPYKIFACNFR